VHFISFSFDILIIFYITSFLSFFLSFFHFTFFLPSIHPSIHLYLYIETLLAIDFDPIVITLVWDETFSSFVPDTTNPLSIDRSELHDITGQHMLEALQAELHDYGIQFLDLRVSAGLPSYETRTLPLTLTGQVVFNNSRQVLGPASLRRVLLQTTFQNTNANDLYLFRLKIANDPTLQNVVTVLAGKDALIQYTLQYNGGSGGNSNNGGNNNNKNNEGIDFSDFTSINTDTSTEEGFVSVLLIAIIVAVGLSIVAVVCFIYCLICKKPRSRTSGKAAKTLEENSLVDIEDGPPPSVITGIPTNIHGRYRKSKQQKKENKKLLSSSTNSKNSNNNNKGRSSRRSNRSRGRYASMSASSQVSDNENYDEVHAVRTAPTQEMMEGGGEYDIEFNFAGSNLDDGVSEYDMETLPPPSTHVPDTDDEAAMMSIMDGMVDNVDDYNNYNNNNTDDDSDDKTVASSNLGGDYDDNISDAGTSLYSYIPDDTSLTASLVNGPFSSQYQQQQQNKQPDLQQQQLQQQTTMERAQKKSILWSVMDSLNVTKAPPAGSDTDNEGESVYIDDMTFIGDDYNNNNNNNKEKNIISPTYTNTTKKNDTKTMLGNDDNDSFTSSKDSNSLLYKNTAEVEAEAEAVVDAAPTKYPEERKKQFEQVWKQDTTTTTTTTPEDADADADDSVVVEKEASIQTTTPEKEESNDNDNSEEIAAVKTAKRSNKTIDLNNDIVIDNNDAHDDDGDGDGDGDYKEDETAAAVPESQPEEGASSSEAVVDWVPEEKKAEEEIDDDGGDEDEDNRRFLPLPTTLESSFLTQDANQSGTIFDAGDASSVSSGVSETSHISNASIARKGESVRRKKSSKWGATAATASSPSSSASVVSCGGSVCSTDSSKLRSLLGQSDTNDAALVFGKQQQTSSKNNDESSSSLAESEVSMSSCTSNQLKSLLTRTDSKDSVEDEDFLFRQNKETTETTQVVPSSSSSTTQEQEKTTAGKTNDDVVRRTVREEEKKEDFVDEENYDDDDDDSKKNAYLPVAIRPVTPSHNKDDDDETAVSVYSAFSEAPSVDESISSNMGWF
jgi:hypothetical protein